MKIKNIVAIFLIAFFIISCASPVATTPTALVLSNNEPLSTQTPIPAIPPKIQPTSTLTSLLTPVIKYQSTLPKAPSGFSWKIVPEYKLAVLVRDGWFFKQKDVFDMNVVGEVDISQENLNENENFSIGMAIIGFSSDHPDEFAKSLLTEYINKNTITKTTDSWNSKINGRNAQNIKINADFSEKKDVTIQLSVVTSKSLVYLIILKSPSALWEKVVVDYETILRHVTIFDE